jgi:hypothetical protein
MHLEYRDLRYKRLAALRWCHASLSSAETLRGTLRMFCLSEDTVVTYLPARRCGPVVLHCDTVGEVVVHADAVDDLRIPHRQRWNFSMLLSIRVGWSWTKPPGRLTYRPIADRETIGPMQHSGSVAQWINGCLWGPESRHKHRVRATQTTGPLYPHAGSVCRDWGDLPSYPP